MGKPRSYEPEVKAAVMASLLSGQSVNAVAREYDIPKGTVSSWKRRAGLAVGDVTTQKKDMIGDLLIEYLTANIQALKAQAVQFADLSWLSKQSASEVAVLHGVMTDKAIRLLEAFGAGDPPAEG